MVVTIPGYQKIHRLFESYRLHGRGWVPDRGHAKPQCFDDSRDSKNESIWGARREIQRRRRHAPSCMGATEHQSNWPGMRKTLGKPGFCSGEARNRTFGCFPYDFGSSKGTERMLSETTTLITDRGEYVAFASLQRIIPPKALIRYWHSPFRHRFHEPLCLMMARRVLASAVARLFGLTPFGGDAVPHRCDGHRYPAGLQADVESHEFPG